MYCLQIFVFGLARPFVTVIYGKLFTFANQFKINFPLFWNLFESCVITSKQEYAENVLHDVENKYRLM